MHKRLVFICSLLSAILLMLLLNFTNPSEIGPFGVLVFFLSFYVVMFGIATFIVFIFRKMTGKRANSKREDYLYAAMIGFGPILLLLMRAFNILNILTVLLSVVFVLLGCFLIKSRFSVVK